MRITLLILGIGLSCALGFQSVSLFWPEQRSAISSWWCRFWFALGIGLGLSSLTSLFTLVVAGSARILFLVMTEVTILVVTIGLASYWKRPFFLSLPDFRVWENRSQHSSKVATLLFWLCLLSIVLAGSTFVLWTVENPHGGPDAWTFWNLRARLFFRSGALWLERFRDGEWSFPTYPQLLPMNVVRLWSFSGQETVIAPASLAFLFTFATVGLLISALSLLRGRYQALIGGLLLSGTPFFIRHGASQYADVPFGFYVLATLVMLNLADHMPEQSYRLIGLAGLSAGFAAWTKNEGILFMGCMVLAQAAAAVVLKRSARSFFRRLLAFLAGLLPDMLILLYYRSTIAPKALHASSLDFQQLFGKLSDISRYIVTAKAFVRHFVEPYSLVYSTPIAIVVLYAFFLGFAWKQFKNLSVVASVILLCLMGTGYFMVYITTHYELTWLIQTTLARLFLQLWPGIIFMLLMVIRNPDKKQD